MHTHTPAAALVRLSDALAPDARAMLDAIRHKSLPTVTRYRLTSTKLIHTPGLFAWLINAYQTDRHHAITVMDAGWPTVPADVRRGILDGSQPYTVHGSTVVIEVTR